MKSEEKKFDIQCMTYILSDKKQERNTRNVMKIISAKNVDVFPLEIKCIQFFIGFYI